MGRYFSKEQKLMIDKHETTKGDRHGWLEANR